MSLAVRIAESELPRRLLGAVLSVLVPGAGHVVLGYPKVGWIVAGASLALGGAIIGAALTVSITAFLLLGALYILGTVASVVSIFALPPGPRLKDGLRALWPALVLLAVFRGASYVVRTYLLLAHVASDGAMGPAIVKGDLMLLRPTSIVRPGDVALVAQEDALWLRRVQGIADHQLVLSADDPSDLLAKQPVKPAVESDVRGRGLFVFMAARGTDGRGRIWKPLTRAP